MPKTETELELIKTVEGKYYWFMDSKYVYLNSVNYNTESDAVYNLKNQTIKWQYETLFSEKEKWQ